MASKLLASLDEAEKSSFLDFIQSPYFNKKEILVQLAKALLTYAPDYRPTEPKVLFNQLWPEKPFQTQKLNEVYSQLAKLLRSFLYQQTLRNTPELSYPARFLAFQNRNLSAEFAKLAHREVKQCQNSPQDKQAKLRYWQVYERVDHYPGPKNPDFDAADQALDYYYYCSKLRYEINLLAFGSFYKNEDRQAKLDAIIQSAKAIFPEEPLIQLYLQLPDLLKAFDLESFNRSLEFYFKIYENLDLQDRYFFLRSFLNIANRAFDANNKALIRAIFELYQYAIAQGLFQHAQPMTETTFLNIVTIGAFLKEDDWITQFIEDHYLQLPEDKRDDAKALASGLFLFHTGQFNAAFDLLKDMPFKSFGYKLRIRSLIVRCLLESYLDQSESEPLLLDYLHNFNQFIYRTRRLQDRRRMALRNMNKVIFRITKLHRPRLAGTKEKAALREWTLQLDPPCAAQAWLLEKLK